MPDDDRLDRNWRSQTDGTDRIKDQLNDFGTKLAIVSTKLEGLTDTVQRGLGNVDATFREFNSRYATKEDCNTISKNLDDATRGLRADVDEIRRNLAKGVWIILSSVVIGILSLLFKTGLLHS